MSVPKQNTLLLQTLLDNSTTISPPYFHLPYPSVPFH